jgi:hypothetical protein
MTQSERQGAAGVQEGRRARHGPKSAWVRLRDRDLRAIQRSWFCTDPFEITRGDFGAAIHCLKPPLVRSTFDSSRAVAIERHSA